MNFKNLKLQLVQHYFNIIIKHHGEDSDEIRRVQKYGMQKNSSQNMSSARPLLLTRVEKNTNIITFNVSIMDVI